MSRTRVEHDSLGDIEVPADALYGAQTLRAVRNFPISGKTARPELIRAYLRIKAAAAKANQACGALTEETARLIGRAVDELLTLPDESLPAHFPVDPYQAGAGTSQNMNANEVVANVANRIAGRALGSYSPIHPNDHVNRSQSTNDSFPTAMRLAILEASGPLVSELELLAHSLSVKAHEWAAIPKSARTHLQDAVPMRLGQEFAAYSRTVRKCAHWVAMARDELRELGIGGSAAGTGLTVPPGYTVAIVRELEKLASEKLRVAADLCEAMQSQSPVSYYSSMLRLTALELTRICNDLRLMASGPMTGLAELLLPAVQPGSSIMPGKVNPSILEMANQAWFHVLGHDQTVAYAGRPARAERDDARDGARDARGDRDRDLLAQGPAREVRRRHGGQRGQAPQVLREHSAGRDRPQPEARVRGDGAAREGGARERQIGRGAGPGAAARARGRARGPTGRRRPHRRLRPAA
jgi:aspartate ammonia-lyase